MPETVTLTYHRLVPSGEECAFHDVSWNALGQQLSHLAGRLVRIQDGLAELDNGWHVCVTFDDGTEDHRDAALQLEQHGLTGTFFIVTDWIGRAGYLGARDIKAMARRGHRIGAHSRSHRRFALLSPREVRSELRESKTVLEDLTGQAVTWFAPPGGSYTKWCQQLIQEAGYSVWRTMEWGYSARPLRGKVPCIPILAHYGLRDFARIVDGRAPLWQYHAKNLFKRVIGEQSYSAFRSKVTQWRQHRT